jgi:hypothetical protein
MVNRYEKKLQTLPVAERRGVWTTWEADTWEALLIRGGFDEVLDRLKAAECVVGVERDVTESVLAGKQPAPEGLWYLLVELVGTGWLHLAHGLRHFDHLDWLAKQVGVPVMRTGFQDTAGSTYVVVIEGEKKILDFESTGMEDFGDDDFDDDELDDEEYDDDYGDPSHVPLRFETELLNPDWPKQFKSEDQVQQALMRELEAYVPMLGSYPEDGIVQLWAGHEDVLDAKYIQRIALLRLNDERSALPRDGWVEAYDDLSAKLSEKLEPLQKELEDDGLYNVLKAYEDATEKIDDLVHDDGTVDSKLSALLAAVQPAIELESDDSPWRNKGYREEMASVLELEGFSRIGRFRTTGGVPVKVLAYVHEADRLYATVYEAESMNWCDVVRLHEDNTVLSVTSIKQPGVYELPRFRKIRKPGLDIKQMVAIARSEPVPEGGLKQLSAERFVQDVNWSMAEEQAELRRNISM